MRRTAWSPSPECASRGAAGRNRIAEDHAGNRAQATSALVATALFELPKGKKLVTLRDAALYITKLPKAEHDAVEWLAAMEGAAAGRRA